MVMASPCQPLGHCCQQQVDLTDWVLHPGSKGACSGRRIRRQRRIAKFAQATTTRHFKHIAKEAPSLCASSRKGHAQATGLGDEWILQLVKVCKGNCSTALQAQTKRSAPQARRGRTRLARWRVIVRRSHHLICHALSSCGMAVVSTTSSH